MAMRWQKMRRNAMVAVAGIAAAGCMPAGTEKPKIEEDLGCLKVSWYGQDWQGVPTASGEPFDMNSLTAAHRSLPFGTRLLLINPKNGKSVVVTINNRGPHVKGRDLDVSAAAAKKLGFYKAGVAVLKSFRMRQDDGKSAGHTEAE